VLPERIRVLRLHVIVADLNGVQLVPADAAVEDLLLPGFGVEGPPAAVADDRDRQRPVLCSDREGREVGGLRVGNDFALFAGVSRPSAADDIST
jgi:hypothetical protein